jgi:hypothetical protein
MPPGDGLADAEGVADGEHHVADLERVRGTEGDRRKVFRVDAQHGEVGLGVVADDLGEQLLAVVQRDLDLVGGLDHVMVGEHVAAVLTITPEPRLEARASGTWSPKKRRNTGSLSSGWRGASFDVKMFTTDGVARCTAPL